MEEHNPPPSDSSDAGAPAAHMLGRPDVAPIPHTNLLGPVILSLLVLFVIGLLTYEPGTFGEMARTLNVWILLAGVGFVVARVLAGGLRLKYVSKRVLSFGSATRGQLAWEFASNVTPSAVGGAPLAAVYIARDNRIPMGEATALVLFCMLLDQLWFACSVAIVFVASFWVDVYPNALGDVGAGILTLYFLGLLLWVTLFAYATLVKPELLQRLANLFLRIKWLKRFQGRVTTEMILLKERAKVLRRQPAGFFVIGFLLAAAVWIFKYLALVFIVWSVYEALPVFQFFIRTIAMLLSALAMPTPGGAGGIEGLYALFLSPLIPSAIVAPTLLTWRLVAYYSFIAIGVLLTTHQVRKAVARRNDMAALTDSETGTG